ncbi:MAG: PEP-CTERM sorting domain-containing protein [Spartobacteria bacterium]|nr:PEP-CTERM sorting domain-containing protein [Spartobacteria bacterium]
MFNTAQVENYSFNADVDSVSWTMSYSIPEPTTAVLLLLGLIVGITRLRH